MAVSITIRSIERRDSIAYVRFGDSEIEIPASNVAEVREWIQSQFGEKEETLLALALAVLIAKDPELTNPGIIVGRTITLDLQGRVNYPDSVLRVS